MTQERIGLTQRDLESGFRGLGLSEGMFVEVHSSLSSFGHVEGGAETVIRALMNVVTARGAIVMTSFPMSKRLEPTESETRLGITCKIKLLDPDSDEPTGMGAISDTFRRMPNVRTGQGLHRVSAWGAEADRNSEGLANLHARDGYALLLGVDIYSLTSMHYAEGKLPGEITAIFRPSPEVLALYPENEWYVETGRPPVNAWHTIQDRAYREGLVRDAMIGKAKCMFFKANGVIALYKSALETDPLGLYGLKPVASGEWRDKP